MTKRRPSVRRALALTVAVLAVAALAGACSGFGAVGPPAAAMVGDHRITTDDVFEVLDAQRRNLEVEQREAEGSEQAAPADPSSLFGAGKDGTWKMATFSGTLESLIKLEVVKQELARQGITITDEQREQARADLVAQIGSEEALNKRDEKLVEYSVETNAAQAALRDTLVEVDPGDREEQLRQAYEEQKEGAAEVCLSIITTASEADGDDVRARLEAGEDFATLAQEVSTDEQTKANGGNAGCGTIAQASQLIPSLTAESKTGDLYGPVRLAGTETELWAVAKVDSIQVPTFEQMRPQLEQSVPAAGTEELQAAFTELLADADVTVASKYGSWESRSGTVRPPAGATATTAPPVSEPAPAAG